MKKLLMALFAVVLLAGVAFAAVQVSTDGTGVGKTDRLDFVGPDISQSGSTIIVDSTYHTGDKQIVDGAIYVSTPYAAIWFRSSTGICARCGVDAAGTTWACAAKTCPAGK